MHQIWVTRLRLECAEGRFHSYEGFVNSVFLGDALMAPVRAPGSSPSKDPALPGEFQAALTNPREPLGG